MRRHLTWRRRLAVVAVVATAVAVLVPLTHGLRYWAALGIVVAVSAWVLWFSWMVAWTLQLRQPQAPLERHQVEPHTVRPVEWHDYLDDVWAAGYGLGTRHPEAFYREVRTWN